MSFQKIETKEQLIIAAKKKLNLDIEHTSSREIAEKTIVTLIALGYPKGIAITDDEYKKAKKDYVDSTYSIESLFERCLAFHNGVFDNPKAVRLFSKAYELGHTYGYIEIANRYEDLVELIA